MTLRIHHLTDTHFPRLVLGGHLHRGARHDEGNTTFIVGSSTLEPYAGYGELTCEKGSFRYAFLNIPG